jgi:predicted transposase YdaD
MSTSGRSGPRGGGAYDQALKLLGERWAADLAALLIPDAHLEEVLPGTLPASERRVDWLWRARLGDEPCALHVEFQLRAKPDLAERMYVYASRIFAQYHLPTLGVLVYLVNTRPLAVSPFVVTLGNRQMFTYPFDVVKLWELDPAPILAGDLAGMLPLVPLMRGALPDQLPRLAERVLETPDLDALARGDLLSMVATFGALRFPKTNIWEAMRRSPMFSELIDELIEDSPFLRKIHDDAVAEGREEGREQGREQGREEGSVSEAQTLLRDLARDRFPDLTDADLAPIATTTSRERLHALARALPRLPDADAFRQALQAPPA